MTKIDIISGFLGAGKTTLIKKLLKEAFTGEKVVLIENEFGEIGIDGSFLKEAGVQITEMNSGCICCSLVGDFGQALQEVLEKFSPDRVIIEPSGVGKLSDVIKAVQGVSEKTELKLNSTTAVVDAKKCKMYMKNFGEFFNNQVENAGTIVLSRTQDVTDEKLLQCVRELQQHNNHAAIITTPWDVIDGKKILAAIEKQNDFVHSLFEEEDICPSCGHHHNHEDHDHEGHGHHHDHEDHDHEGHGHYHDHEDHDHECCGHHHDHEEHDHECCGHHHDHEEHDHECCGHHHDHEDHECCGHHHDHEGHHHADEVFTSFGVSTPHKYGEEELDNLLKILSESEEYGIILRAKGILPSTNGEWLYFDLVPGEYEIRKGNPDYTGRLCVIGSQLNEKKLSDLFNL